MAKYHKYVFDTEARRLVGDFDAMYQAEESEGFDSWHSHDARQLRLRLALALVDDHNFANILEIGCGKGTTTQFLKKRNNRVLGIDLSPSAIKKAKASFPDIEFMSMDASKIEQLGQQFDLVTMQGVLAYIPAWRDLMSKVATMTDHCLVAEYIPANPIGMVKSAAELVETFSSLFEIEHRLTLDDEWAILTGRSRGRP